MNERYEYECALSGLSAEGGYHFEEDGLEDIPPGWTEVRLSRRSYNPSWVVIQQVKKAMIEGLLAQLPEDARKAQALAIRLQVDAQFHQMERDTAVYLTDVETVYLGPRELSEDIGEAYNEAREMLGLEPIEDEAEEEEAEADKNESKEAKGS